MSYTLHSHTHKGRGIWWITHHPDATEDPHAQGAVVAAFVAPEDTRADAEHELRCLEAADATDRAYAHEVFMREAAEAVDRMRNDAGRRRPDDGMQGASQ